jgi:hypothetical protein
MTHFGGFAKLLKAIALYLNYEISIIPEVDF